MNDIPNDLIKRLKDIYRDSKAGRNFLDAAAARRNDASATSIDRIMKICDCDRGNAVQLAKEFDEAEVGQFVVGRRGAPSRVEWLYSLVSIGRSAVGETSELVAVAPNAAVDEDDEGDVVSAAGNAPSTTAAAVVIAQAKDAISRALGISQANIEITIRA